MALHDLKLDNFLISNDVDVLLLQGLGPYANLIKKTEKDIKEMAKKVNDLCGMLIFPIP